jgi:hypothetical protein
LADSEDDCGRSQRGTRRSVPFEVATELDDDLLENLIAAR